MFSGVILKRKFHYSCSCIITIISNVSFPTRFWGLVFVVGFVVGSSKHESDKTDFALVQEIVASYCFTVVEASFVEILLDLSLYSLALRLFLYPVWISVLKKTKAWLRDFLEFCSFGSSSHFLYRVSLILSMAAFHIPRSFCFSKATFVYFVDFSSFFSTHCLHYFELKLFS